MYHIQGIPEGEEREKGTKGLFQTIMTEFPQSNVWKQITDPRSSETISRINAKKKKKKSIQNSDKQK